MKIVSIILSLTFIFGMFTVNTQAYTRQENIVSKFNDFENGVGDWTNGNITGVVNDNGNLTTSTASLRIDSDASGTHGKYLVAVSTANNERECPTLLFDVVNARQTSGGASSSAKLKNGTAYGFEFDFRIPTENNSSTPIEIKLWDTARSRNRGTIFKITPSNGKVENNSNNQICTLTKNTWYKIKIESVAGTDKHRIIIMDDLGTEIANGRYNTAIAAQSLVTFISFSKGGTNCEMHFDNTRLYTFDEADLNVGRTAYNDNTDRTINSSNSSFEIEAHNDFTGFSSTVEHPTTFVIATKLKIDDTTKDNDIKISLKEDAVARLVTTISPKNKKVTLGAVSSGATVGGLSMESDTWYDVEIIYNTQTDYQRVEITNTSTNETQVFDGLSGYLPTDISAFDGVLFECSFIEDTAVDFDKLNIYVASQSHAAPFYTMDSYELEANASEFVIKTSAALTGVSNNTVTLKDGDGNVIPASVSYNGTDTITILPSKTFKENERLQVILSKEILVGGEKPKFDTVVNFKILIDEITMDLDLKADGEDVLQSSDLKGKSNINCNISSSLRTGTTSFNGMYVMTIMGENNEIKAISADDISLSEFSPSGAVSLSLPVPDGGENLEIYIMLIDNFQSSKALAKYIKIH